MLLLFLSACCSNSIAPILDSPQNTTSSSNQLEYDLSEFVIDSTLDIEELEFSVSSSHPNINASIQNKQLLLESSEQNSEGWITVSVLDACEEEATIEFEVQFAFAVLF